MGREGACRWAFGTTPATVPSASPYPHADELKVAAWRTRLAALSGQRPRIRLTWAGSSKLPSDFVGPGAPGASQGHFAGLQKDGPAALAAFPLASFMDEMEDFADTTALIANIDLVISVDTAVAHLAAAIGKPVWMLDRLILIGAGSVVSATAVVGDVASLSSAPSGRLGKCNSGGRPRSG